LLSIDGDEVPSQALVSALPELVSATDVVQYWLPRRWLYPDTRWFLSDAPWWPDFQVRLMRNDATLAARAELHAGFVASLPSRHVDEPLYHLDVVLNDAGSRASKVARYATEAPGLAAYGGGELSEVMYLPERWIHAPACPVPEDDRATIEHVVAARTAAPEKQWDGEVPLVVVAPAVEVDALASTRVLRDTDYAVALTLFAESAPVRLAPDELRPLYVVVGNRGRARWPWGLEQQPAIRVSYHWRSIDGRVREFEGLRSPLPCTVAPGESTIVPVWVRAPSEPGPHLLDVDLVHEGVRWFDSPLTIAIGVAERARRDPAP
jgi:hypothetical protein